MEKNKDKVHSVATRLVISSDIKTKNVKDKNKYTEKEKDKYKTKDKNKDKNKEKEDDGDNGWKTDESSELSEEEYSYSK